VASAPAYHAYEGECRQPCPPIAWVEWGLPSKVSSELKWNILFGHSSRFRQSTDTHSSVHRGATARLVFRRPFGGERFIVDTDVRFGFRPCLMTVRRCVSRLLVARTAKFNFHESLDAPSGLCGSVVRPVQGMHWGVHALKCTSNTVSRIVNVSVSPIKSFPPSTHQSPHPELPHPVARGDWRQLADPVPSLAFR